MIKKYTSSILALALVSGAFALLNGCQKDAVTPPAAISKSLTEEFDTVANMYNRGWVFSNNSKPIGAGSWSQGIYGGPFQDPKTGVIYFDGFNAYSYKAAANEYAMIGYSAASGSVPTLSSWMITPELEIKNGDKISFYARATSGSSLPQRLQVRLNATDNTADVGYTTESVGKFTVLLGEVNAAQTLGAFPSTWTRYDFTVSGLPTVMKTRLALRYYVNKASASTAIADAIGVDQFQFESR